MRLHTTDLVCIADIQPVMLLKTVIESGRPLSPIGKLCTVSIDVQTSWPCCPLPSFPSFRPCLVLLMTQGLFCLHYLHRSILSPLVYSPKRSDQHVIVTISAGAFNVLNAYLVACSLAFFPPTQSLTDIRTVIGVVGFLICFGGNGRFSGSILFAHPNVTSADAQSTMMKC